MLDQHIFEAYNIPRDSMESIYFPLYDVKKYAGENCVTFFQVPMGLQGKTYADTNMQMPGCIYQGQLFDAWGFQITYDGTKRKAFSEADSYVELVVGNKLYAVRGPVGIFMAPWGAAIAHVVLGPQVHFQVRIVFPNEAPACRGRITMSLLGSLYRPYQ